MHIVGLCQQQQLAASVNAPVKVVYVTLYIWSSVLKKIAAKFFSITFPGIDQKTNKVSNYKPVRVV